MKVNRSDLKELYVDYIREKTPQSRKNCPSADVILKCMRFKISKRKKTKIMDHISSCSYCAQEFKFALEVLREESKLSKEIEQALELKLQKLGEKRKYRKIFLPKLSWTYATVFAVLILTISVSLVMLLKNHETAEYLRGISNQFNLIEPIDKTYLLSELSFKWEKYPDSDHYIIEIFDDELCFVWRSSKIFRNITKPTRELVKLLKQNRKYFWMVTAFLTDGNKMESRIEEFKIKK